MGCTRGHSQDIRAAETQPDGLVADGLVGACQSLRFRLDLLPDALVVKEALAGAVQEPARQLAG